MAYITQEQKKKIAALVAPILKKYGVKATFGINHHSTLSMTISAAPFDLIADFNNTPRNQNDRMYQPAKDYLQVNLYWFQEHFSGKTLQFLNEMVPVLFTDHWDKSDIQSDYFNCSWYVHLNIGRWNKPFQVK